MSCLRRLQGLLLARLHIRLCGIRTSIRKRLLKHRLSLLLKLLLLRQLISHSRVHLRLLILRGIHMCASPCASQSHRR